jgi:hypothetical protein
MLVVEGEIKKGYGAASSNLELQMPHFLNVFPEIKSYHSGSINVLLNTPIKLLRPGFRTSPIQWHPVHPNLKEIFNFTRIDFEIIDSVISRASVKARIYDPEQSPHHRDPFYYEIITETIDVREYKRCRIYFNRKYKKGEFFSIE